MKRTLSYLVFLLFALTLAASCGENGPKYRLNVTMTGAPEGMKVYLYTADVFGTPIDSALVEAGKFSFQPVLGYPQLCNIVLLKHEDRAGHDFFSNPAASIFVSDGTTDAVGEMERMATMFEAYMGNAFAGVTVNNPSHNKYAGFVEGMKPMSEERSKIFNEYSAFLGSQKTADAQPVYRGIELVDRLDALKGRTRDQVRDFVAFNSDDPVVLTAIDRYIGSFTSTDQIDGLMALVSAELLAGEGVASFKDKIAGIRSSSEGAIFIDHELTDPEGNPVRLSDYLGKGKYVLVEFWASWCGPCRSDIPHLKEVYGLYHPEGFEIVGVSMDGDKDAWLKALAEEQLAWPQMSDLKAFEGDLSKVYNFNGIPACVLVAPDGTIADRNMRGSWMDRKLIELYGDKFMGK